jgi:hypothetical protein
MNVGEGGDAGQGGCTYASKADGGLRLSVLNAISFAQSMCPLG